MPAIYDNWERLVAAVLKREQLWQLFHDHSRSPSVLSEASSFSSSFDSGSFDISILGSSSRLQKALPKLVLISDFSPAFGDNDFSLASAKLLGKGTFGSSYVAAMGNGVKIVVKRLKSVSISDQDFKPHMDIVGNVRHENVAALRGFYFSEGEKLVLYDYYPKGSIYALLHGQTSGNRAHVGWKTRLKIAIGAARGIAEIHRQNGGRLVHGNIKSSNIFLNAQQYGCVSDLGLANVIETTFMPTARCYAPEVKISRNVSQASDVYSFGIVLLELLTRKSTAHFPGGSEPVDLVKLVGSVKSKEVVSKVFDADLLSYPTIREDMVKMLQIGLKCVAKSIKKRPKMSELVKMLEGISRINLEGHPPERLVFVEDANPAFELNDVLTACDEVLGEGTFGTCYKGRLENGNTIVVKRLKNVIIPFQDFQQHLEDNGRMRHENVVDAKAYYFSSYETILVYDYHLDPLSALLHGKSGTSQIPLDWESRLRVAVGAARGIAHIHRQDGQKLVHGNIKSSNIFINRKKYGTVSDVGLAKLAGIKLSALRTPGYCAPEITYTRNFSQACDVYSFGVVLLELLTGRPPQHTSEDDVISLVKWMKYVAHIIRNAKVFVEVPWLHPDKKGPMMQLLEIAMGCVVSDPERRPTMPEIVKMLEELGGLDPSGKASLDDVLEDGWEQPSIESRLEDILEDLLRKLSP